MDQNQYNQSNNMPTGQQPHYSPYGPNLSSPLSVGQYILIFILMAIPIVNIVMLFVWAFGDCNINKRNYARAVLILALISIVLGIVMSIMFGSLFNILLRSTDFVPNGF